MPWNHEQSALAENNATATSIAVAFAGNVGTGQRLLVVGLASDGGVVDTVTDTLGTTYALARLDDDVAVYWGLAPSGGGADTVTVTWTASVPFRRLVIHEYSGNALTNLVDQVNSAEALDAGPANSGSVTTGEGNELIFGFLKASGMTTITPGTNETFAQRQEGTTSDDRAFSEDAVKAAAGSTSAQATFDTANFWRIVLVTFRGATAITAGTEATTGWTLVGRRR